MTEGPDNIVLQYLRHISTQVDRLVEEMRDVKVRLTNLEENAAVVSRRLDRIENRLDRIDVRLGLAEV
jgi:hypothetical protein